MFKKIIAVFLLGLMIFAVSCSSTPSETPTEPQHEMSIINYINFRWGVSREDFTPTPGKTTIGDQILARYDEIRNKYNMDFVVESVSADYDTIAKRVAGGKDLFDMFFGAIRKIGIPAFEGNYLYALEDIPTIDPSSEKWGIKHAISYGKINGKQYGFFPNEWGIMPDFEGVILFNEDLIDFYKVASPYELQESGNWNWSNFTNMLQTIKDSGIECHPWAPSSLHESVIYCFHSNGMRGLIRGDDGEYEYGFFTAAGMETLDWLAECGRKGLFAVGVKENNKALFTEQKKMVFWSSGSREATTVSDNPSSLTCVAAIENLGFIPYPYGPSGNRNSCSATTEHTRALNYCMNITENSAEQIGEVMNFLFRPLSESEESTWQYRAKEWMFTSEQAYDNFIWMLENCNYDYSAYYPDSYNAMDAHLDKICRGEENASTVFESMRGVIKNEIKSRIAALGEPSFD